jgi:hypothetical protein
MIDPDILSSVRKSAAKKAIITAYIPNLEEWEHDYKRRKKP